MKVCALSAIATGILCLIAMLIGCFVNADLRMTIAAGFCSIVNFLCAVILMLLIHIQGDK